MITDETIKGEDFANREIAPEYECCEFINCDLSASNLDGVSFIECVIKDTDLSNASLKNTAFKDVRFENCKLLGLHFDDCNPFLLEVSFESCQLDLSCFYGMKLKGTSFVNCILKEVDFAEADLSASSFSGSDLTGATFERTIIEKADFRGAYGYSIDPENNSIKKAKFSKEAVIGLLSAYDIKID